MARRKNQGERRGQLTRAAQRAIAARGVDSVRVKDVAEEAGLSPQSVLYYYPNFADLVEEALHHTVQRFAERRFEDAEQLADPRAALVATIRAGLPTGPDDQDLRILYEAAGYFRDHPTHGALIRSLTSRQVEVYRRILDIGAERGVFALADDSRSIARNLVALEDAYGLYIISGGPFADEAYRQITAFARMATGCDLDRPRAGATPRTAR